MRDAVQQDLLNSEVLKIGINLGNILLVTGKTADGAPEGVAPDMGRALADRLGVEAQFVMFASPGEVADAAAHGKWDVGLIAREP